MKTTRTFLITLLLALSTQTPAWAVEFGSSRPSALADQSLQSYFERPDILQVTARAHSDLRWQEWREAHLEAAAAFLELYPTEHLYFLARDAELLYDAVRLISRDDPQTLARLHLVNVSRANMRDPLLLEYLAQEGLTVERLRADPSFHPVLIDTGFSGTIPRVIGEAMPRNVRRRLKAHLLASSNPGMPSLRSFLLPINPAINGHSPSSMHGTIIGYEHIPRATARSTTYRRIQDQVHPLSGLNDYSDGQVNASVARQYQEDLKSFLESSEGKHGLKESRQLWKKLRTNWTTLSREQWIHDLTLMMSPDQSPTPQTEAAIRDFLEWVNLIGRHFNPSAPNILIEDIGISAGAVATQLSNKAALIAKFPQWASILEDPDTQIPALLDSGQIGTLGAILDVVKDQEIIGLALEAIAERLGTASVYALAEALIENVSTKNWILRLFGQAETASYPELFRLAIEKASPEDMGQVAWTLDTPHWAEQLELLTLAVQKAAPVAMGSFTHALRRHLIDRPDLTRIALEKALPGAMRSFAHVIFGNPASADLPELLRLAIEKTPPRDMDAFTQWALNEPHWGGHPELLRLAIERAAPVLLHLFNTQVLNQPHWKNHPQIKVFAAAVQIVNPEHRAEYLRTQLAPYSWESEAPGVCEQQMLKD